VIDSKCIVITMLKAEVKLHQTIVIPSKRKVIDKERSAIVYGMEVSYVQQKQP
jgi:hypothetical protein